jgi:hypothetical protein
MIAPAIPRVAAMMTCVRTQQVPEQHSPVAGAQSASSQHELGMPQHQDLASDQTSHAGPADHPDYHKYYR